SRDARGGHHLARTRAMHGAAGSAGCRPPRRRRRSRSGEAGRPTRADADPRDRREIWLFLLRRAALGSPSMTSAPQIIDVDGYLELVCQRLREEGFTVSRGARVASFALKAVATRHCGSLGASSTMQILFITQEELGLSPRGVESVSPETL